MTSGRSSTAKQLIARTYLLQSDHAQAARANDEVAALAERLGDPFHVARRWFIVGLDGPASTAASPRLATRSSSCERPSKGVEEPVMEAFADTFAALVDVWEGEPERALELLRWRLERTVKSGAGIVVPDPLTSIAFAELAAGRLEQARRRLEGLVPLVEGRDGFSTSWALGLLAEAQRLLADGAAEATALRGPDRAASGSTIASSRRGPA